MTKSPTVSVPACTSIAAITITATSPAVMISVCPAFSAARLCPVFTAAPS